MAEILIYDRAVSDIERLQVLNYLSSKWGVAAVQLANKPPTVSLLTPTNGTPVSAPGWISVVAQVTNTSPIARVDFIANGSVVASRTAAPYQIPLQVLTPGPMTLSVQVVDIWGLSATSAPVALTITGSGPATPPASGLVLWLKADAGVTTNTDGSVATWLDQSGTGNHAVMDQGYSLLGPLFNSDTNTGKPALYFDGYSRDLVVSNAPSLALTDDMSLFYGASFDDFDAARCICGKTVVSEPLPFDYYVNTAGRAVIDRGWPGVPSAVTGGPVPAGSFVLASATVSGAFGYHFLGAMPNGSGIFYQPTASPMGAPTWSSAPGTPAICFSMAT